jgi:arylsulfatase
VTPLDWRIDGASLVPTFSDPNAGNDHTQYFEIAGNRAIYHEGWIASTTPLRTSTYGRRKFR